MILHYVLNTLVVFLLLAGLIELILSLFRVENGRVRTLCRALPFLKLPLDLMLFTCYGDFLSFNFNPLSCQLFVQELLFRIMPDQVRVEFGLLEHLVIPSYIASLINPSWLSLITLSILLISAVGAMRKLFQLINSLINLRQVLQESQPNCYPIINERLRAKIRALNVQVLVSSQVQIPCAVNRRLIIFPEELLSQLSQEEYEAVVAHEIEHLKWRDPFLRIFCVSIGALFWWIPTSWWLRRLEEEQELASDGGLSNYGLDSYPLATALMKAVNGTIKGTKRAEREMNGFCHFSNSRSAAMRRLEQILKSPKERGDRFARVTSLQAILLCSLTFLAFWAC